jgi:tetratricopeptide (TPR) repeat protein
MLLKDQLAAANKMHIEAVKTNNQEMLELVTLEYNAILNQSPDNVGTLFLLGTAYLQQGCNGLAINLFQRCLAQDRLQPEFWNNLGSAWKHEHNNAKAETCFRRALMLHKEQKNQAEVLNNLCTLWINEGDPEKGIRYVEQGLQFDPEEPKLHWNYSLLLLEQERWKEGFYEYEYGLSSGDRLVRVYGSLEACPFWDGQEDLSDKTVVVYGEQGMGDEIMFLSALEALKNKAKRVILDCHPRMEALMKRSFPWATVYATRKDKEIDWPENDPPDRMIAAGSLFYHFRRNGKFPKKRYLKVDPKKRKEYREILELLGPGPYIGIGWKGGSKKTRIDLRSTKLGHLQKLMEKKATFVSLQYTPEAMEKVIKFKRDNPDIHLVHLEDVVRGRDYDETAALVAALDLCILPNTTATHLCGALGSNCWTITPKAHAWRYGKHGDHMPFYGEWVKQYHQSEGKDHEHAWGPTLERIGEDLDRFIGRRK